jgi:hypothetical protein
MGETTNSDTDGEPNYPKHITCNECEFSWMNLDWDEDAHCPECGAGPGDRTIEEEMTVRAKWTMDGAETIDEMADALEARAEAVRSLKDDRWELQEPVNDDYAFLLREQQ